MILLMPCAGIGVASGSFSARLAYMGYETAALQIQSILDADGSERFIRQNQ